ncbi:hypothetical protein B0A48_04784 [Cryoendolithus antarcticus]|uniref:Uncharacterized protein n=1 Tax=Cryoendolithus antarcticus TaxID=1507870 RepID=A0A1V8TDC6_9PEZI|nr:hypothetical protein B0A48_04784 [Cryoendolithus antarcticus]
MSHPLQSGPLNLVLLVLDQARSYTSQLVQTHLQLGVLCRELAHVDHQLERREDNTISRKTRKHLQWRRALLRAGISRQEVHQEILYQYLRECGSLASSMGTPIPGSVTEVSSPWTTSTSFDDLNVPFSPPPPTPWTAGPFDERRSTIGYVSAPQYWDLSMLREDNEGRTPRRSHSATDSGFHEPLIPGDVGEGIDDPAHVWSHERMAQHVQAPITVGQCSSTRSPLSSGKNEISDLSLASSSLPTEEKAEESAGREHRRRHSDLVACRTQDSLDVSTTVKRALSVGPASPEEETGA